MTVEQLIARLQEFPPYREVVIRGTTLRTVREVQGDGEPQVALG